MLNFLDSIFDCSINADEQQFYVPPTEQDLLTELFRLEMKIKAMIQQQQALTDEINEFIGN